MRSGSGSATRAASCTARARASARLTRSWMRTDSAICRPTVRIGLSAVRGSWKTMPMSSPRSSRELAVGEAEQLAPVPADRSARRRAVGEQPEDREGGERLARPGFADEAHPRAVRHVERDAVDDAPVADVDREVVHFEGHATTSGTCVRAARARAAAPRQRRVGRLAQPVAEQVEPEHGERDREPRPHDRQRMHGDELLQLGEEEPPRRLGHGGAEAEVRQARLGEHGDRHAPGQLHDEDRCDVRQQVPPEVLGRGEARHAPGEHEVAVQHAAQLRPGDAGDVDAEADADRPHHHPQRTAPHRRDHHRDDEHRERDEDVDEHRDRLAHPARRQRAERGERDADHRRDDPRPDGDDHRRAGAGHDEAQDVASRRVGAEQVRPARRRPAVRGCRPAAGRTASRTRRRPPSRARRRRR